MSEPDIADHALMHWKMALYQANGDNDEMVAILAAALAFTAAETTTPLSEVIDLVKANHKTSIGAKEIALSRLSPADRHRA